jgi:hypothetical protein
MGHVILPWHFGSIACIPGQASFDAKPLGPTSTRGLTAATRTREQEAEAHRFAGALLLPRSFLDTHSGRAIGDVIEILNRADISATAAILSLAQNLLPGFCFLIDDDYDEPTLVRSSGTTVPAREDRDSWEIQLREDAHGFGETTVSGRRVLWFRFSSQEIFTLPEDERSTRDLLLDSLVRTTDRSIISALVKRINGIVGGMLSKPERVQSTTQALSILEHRFSSDPELQCLMELSDFRLYLRRKAAERINRCLSLQPRSAPAASARPASAAAWAAARRSADPCPRPAPPPPSA